MNKPRDRLGQLLLVISILVFTMLTACAAAPADCPPIPKADLSHAAAFAGDNGVPFQFPLDEISSPLSTRFTQFCESSVGSKSNRKYHAAEDYFRPPGTPVYAIADGQVSFSGPMGGYGWLIIIDHPQANLYSLYGHLSPSRWRMEPGPVEKGQLIGYLGDADENGGSAENPLVPHLHLGIRVGQRSDYPTKGEWRWMAGWIRPCPVDVGWLVPSALIASQDIPPGGFLEPNGGFIAKWGIELLFATIYLVSGFSLLIYTTRKNKPLFLLIGGALIFAAGLYFHTLGWRMSYLLFTLAPLLLGTGIYRLLHRTSFTESAHA